MSEKEKQRIIEAWNKHVEGIARQHKYATFSSAAEEDFCETFRNGILAYESLTKKEKLEICAYARL
ncbi:hypothetical protein HY570_03005 [Candidatus Micrarchaeota archaeon]|nr:hypothetical protein [Candidatus Micrarchaeota archaeon]